LSCCENYAPVFLDSGSVEQEPWKDGWNASFVRVAPLTRQLAMKVGFYQRNEQGLLRNRTVDNSAVSIGSDDFTIHIYFAKGNVLFFLRFS
jgi:hypothetical protein